MRDRLLPDQIHNYAHNNEWCIRNLLHIGRVEDAINLAKNMTPHVTPVTIRSREEEVLLRSSQTLYNAACMNAGSR